MAEKQQEVVEDHNYRNELIALFSDNSDMLFISCRGKESCNTQDQPLKNHFRNESEMIVLEKGNQEASVGNRVPEQDDSKDFYNKDLC